jgi:hypothetical protein
MFAAPRQPHHIQIFELAGATRRDDDAELHDEPRPVPRAQSAAAEEGLVNADFEI